jgi:hypothetical protein
MTGSYLVGDLYLNTTYNRVYRCTTAGTTTTSKWAFQCQFGATIPTGVPSTLVAGSIWLS